MYTSLLGLRSRRQREHVLRKLQDTPWRDAAAAARGLTILLQYDVRRVRVPAMAVGVVMVVHQDLEPHNEALALARTPAVGTGGRADDADAVVGRGGATLLPEVEDALPSREHGVEEREGEEGGGSPPHLEAVSTGRASYRPGG